MIWLFNKLLVLNLAGHMSQQRQKRDRNPRHHTPPPLPNPKPLSVWEDCRGVMDNKGHTKTCRDSIGNKVVLENPNLKD